MRRWNVVLKKTSSALLCNNSASVIDQLNLRSGEVINFIGRWHEGNKFPCIELPSQQQFWFGNDLEVHVLGMTWKYSESILIPSHSAYFHSASIRNAEWSFRIVEGFHSEGLLRGLFWSHLKWKKVKVLMNSFFFKKSFRAYLWLKDHCSRVQIDRNFTKIQKTQN